MLGECEYLLLCTTTRLGDDAYGAPIPQDITLVSYLVLFTCLCAFLCKPV